MRGPKLLPRGVGLILAAACAGLTVMVGWPSAMSATQQAPAPVPISQVPMTAAIPAHPQILLAVANSQSMDGNLSGAVMTGSGAIAAGGVLAKFPELQSSSSPVNFTIPAGFTPPVNAGAGGVAPYTVLSGGALVDNSPSRLNVAKEGLASVLTAFLGNADFALMDYTTDAPQLSTTWAFQMSGPGGFSFVAAPPTGEYVANPCFGVSPTVGDTVTQDCANLAAFYSGSVYTMPYMAVAASSDDPAVNDVLYQPVTWGGIDPLCLDYGGAVPVSPYPAAGGPTAAQPYTLGTYNSGGVVEYYNSSWLPPPGSQSPPINPCPTRITPTNAGYVPYSNQVMYEERGFGYLTWWTSATDATVLVPMTTAGATPTPPAVAAALAKFTPYLAPETNASGSGEIKALAAQSPIAGMLAGAKKYFSGTVPTSNGCAAQRYVVLVTDGLPTEDMQGGSWPPLGSAAANPAAPAPPPNGYGVSATFNGDGSLGTTNDQALTDAINQLTALQAAGVKTYIIGVGAGVDPSANPMAAQTLTAMAIAGGTGAYFPATDPAAIAAGLQSIVTTIMAATVSTTSTATNSTALNATSVVYQSQFTTSDKYQDWTGNLFAFPINATTGVVDTSPADAYWSGQAQLDTQNWNTGRLIATWDPVANAGTPFRWNSGTASSGIANSTQLGQLLTAFAPDPNGQDVLQYLRGSSAQEIRNGGRFRNRSHTLGDIVNSGPQYVGAPSQGEPSASYASFAATYASRPAVVYVGANDGMLHAFDAATGNERFAYIPAGVYSKLIDLASPSYNATHQFYVNGSPQSSDVQFADGTWHTLLVGAEAQGGASVYALDVTNPAAITSEGALASSVLWDFTDVDMGLGFSTPSINDTAAGWLVFVGNGYDSVNEKPVLYALDPQSGAITSKIDLCAAVALSIPGACNPGVANGLSSVAVVNTGGELTGFANLLYAGDLQGNMWRVDISNADPTQWAVSILFQARDASNNLQPITTTPAVSLNPRYPQVLGTMVFFATGELLGTQDLAVQNLQTIYGVYDPPAGYAAPLTRSSLVQQTLTAVSSGTTTLDVVTGNAVAIPTQKGWYIDLSLNPGERVVTDPTLQAGELILTSYIPSTSACTGGGSSIFYVINYATGSSFPSPQFDVNGDGIINSKDTVGSGGAAQNPVAMSLGNVFASAPTTISTAGGSMALTTLSNGTILTTQLAGQTLSRQGWWEVR